MHLHFYSLKKPSIDRDVVSVNLKTSTGEITILDDHLPIITPFSEGTIRIKNKKGEEEKIETEGGILEVRPRGEVALLAD